MSLTSFFIILGFSRNVQVQETSNPLPGATDCLRLPVTWVATFIECWIKEIYLKHTKCQEALLIMDTFQARCSEEIISLLSKHHSSVALKTGCCISKLQPLDISLNKHFKHPMQARVLHLLLFTAVHHVQLSRLPPCVPCLHTH